ncbi:triose-phosphate isomerase [Candidatus Parcubacteria bacterium]|nr:triose-phosphate isomerase [Candidatus Parcubacteria bacterium]
MAEKLVVANWKMNLNPHQASLLVHRLDQKVTAGRSVEVVLCPPFVDLYPVARDRNPKKFKLGAQNIHHLDEGPFTGEVSPAMLQGLVDFVIVGHSERRRHAHEDDKLIARKVAAAVRHGLVPILCVGDNLFEREHGAARKVVADQVTAGLSLLTAAEIKDTVIAYEPVWAISQGDGRGSYAKPHEVEPMVTHIRQTVEELYGEGAGGEPRVLYGGSVNPDNVTAYLEIAGVDGLLVGGASLNYEQFAAIVAAAQAAVHSK